MGSLKIGWSAMGALLIAIVVIAVLVCARFRRDTEAAQERSQSGGSQAIETGWGHIKHTTVGEGSPVLLMHGIFGGFDQGLAIARGNVGGGGPFDCLLSYWFSTHPASKWCLAFMPANYPLHLRLLNRLGKVLSGLSALQGWRHGVRSRSLGGMCRYLP